MYNTPLIPFPFDIEQDQRVYVQIRWHMSYMIFESDVVALTSPIRIQRAWYFDADLTLLSAFLLVFGSILIVGALSRHRVRRLLRDAARRVDGTNLQAKRQFRRARLGWSNRRDATQFRFKDVRKLFHSSGVKRDLKSSSSTSESHCLQPRSCAFWRLFNARVEFPVFA